MTSIFPPRKDNDSHSHYQEENTSSQDIVPRPGGAADVSDVTNVELVDYSSSNVNLKEVIKSECLFKSAKRMKI